MNTIISWLKLAKRTLLDIPKLLWGLLYFRLNGKTPTSAHQSLINLFCLTGGCSNQLLSSSLRLCSSPYKIEPLQGILGNMSLPALKKIVQKLNEDGYYIFENTLSSESCQKLLDFAYSSPATIRGDNIKDHHQAIYQPEAPLAVRYDFDPQILIDHEEVQKLITDHTLLAVAQHYLKAKPILDVIGMWWHTAYQKEPDSSAAQYFHFDMDRIKWLKFFIYLTDVGEENGPHGFVRGSHRAGGIPVALRSKGYARLTDEEVYASYAKEDIIYHLAKKGTIIAEDTRGLHKGQHVIAGDRLVLQIQFSNHLFGATYPRYKFNCRSSRLKQLMDVYPKIYSHFK